MKLFRSPFILSPDGAHCIHWHAVQFDGESHEVRISHDDAVDKNKE